MKKDHRNNLYEKIREAHERKKKVEGNNFLAPTKTALFGLEVRFRYVERQMKAEKRKMRSKGTGSHKRKPGEKGTLNRHALPEYMRSKSGRFNDNFHQRGRYKSSNKSQNKTQIIQNSDPMSSSENDEDEDFDSQNMENNLFKNISNPVRPQHELLMKPPVGSILHKKQNSGFEVYNSSENTSPYKENLPQSPPASSMNLDILGNTGLKLLELRGNISAQKDLKKSDQKRQSETHKHHNNFFYRRGVSEATKELPSCFLPYKKPQNQSTAANTKRLIEIKAALKEKAKIKKEGPRDELEAMIESTMKEHNRLMKISKNIKIHHQPLSRRRNNLETSSNAHPSYTDQDQEHPHKNQIMAAKLIGETEELETAYKEYVQKIKKEKKDQDLYKPEPDEGGNHHEGAIPRNRRKLEKAEEASNETESDKKAAKQKPIVTVQYPKSIYKYLSGNSLKDLNLNKFRKSDI
ncbi:unnamed protein product [Moneuplotes crassus]|uniref:Uncharacterized protein n=1 Tax=Euplotes crassus TaxID=5936 RepID=A0AAD1YBG1_EUPCR|nr:unnamed protein product [Moneuplotes crassus]